MSYLKFLKKNGLFFWYMLIVLLMILGIQYAICPIYNFQTPTPFQGQHWYNPYKQLYPNWYQANFHLHSKTWRGLTNGKYSAKKVFQHYKNLNYDIISLSNYQSIADLSSLDPNYIPVYEHGYNIGKKHQLVIGAGEVQWRDYVFTQNKHQKQHILSYLKIDSTFIVLAHPEWENAYAQKDMLSLTDFDAIEVFNSHKTSIELWDQTLSLGKVAWALGNDDSHNILKEKRTGVCWTMVNAPAKTKSSIINALQKGSMYAVHGKHGVNQNTLEFCQIQDNTLMVKLDSTAKEIQFIGQQGEIKHSQSDTNFAAYLLTKNDSYIRAHVFGDDYQILLNPVFRYDGETVPTYRSSVNYFLTWLQRFGLMFSIITIGYFYTRHQRRELRARSTKITHVPKSVEQKRKYIDHSPVE